MRAGRAAMIGLVAHPRRRNPAFVNNYNEASMCVLILSAFCFLGESLDSNITDKRYLRSVLAGRDLNETISFSDASDEITTSMGQCPPCLSA
jgi:hypothetical protein